MKERKARIEEFVEIYQASNDGKFPTINMIRQHVGGSHYTVRDVLLEVKYNQIKFPFDKSKLAQPHETSECAEQSSPEEEGGNSSFNPQSINGKQDEDDTLPSEKDSATGTVTMNEPLRSLESQDSSHYNGQTQVAKQDLYTADANDLPVSEHAEIDSIKAKLQLDDSEAAQLHGTAECAEQSRHEEESGNNSFNPQDFNGKQDENDTLLSQKDSSTGTIIMENIEPPIHSDLETKSDSENCQGETEANKFHVNNVENFKNPSEPTVSNQTESAKVIKGTVLDREENSEVEEQGSAKTSLLGSLKSFASGIRNFWRNL